MAILGEPDAELNDLLGEIEEIQQAARRPSGPAPWPRDLRGGRPRCSSASPHRAYTDFVAHGMGLISHEAPRLTSKRPGALPRLRRGAPAEAGMVLSIETTMHHPGRGFVKLEDTVAVTETGCEAFGDKGRGWNRGGTAVA